MRETKCQNAQRDADEEDGPPSERGNQNAAERRTGSGADRGHCSEQPHGAARSCLRHGLADERDGERHHDRRAEALHRPGGDQQPERGRDAAQDRGCREQDDPGQQQPSAADDVTEASDTDDQGGDGEEIGEDDPLDLLERGGECLGQRRQAQHWRCWCRARTATWIGKGWRAPTGPTVVRYRTCGGRFIPFGGDWLQRELRCLTAPGMEPVRHVVPSLTWRNAHDLHFIRASDATSRSGRARVDPCRDPISTCFSPSMCCSRKAAWRAPPNGCGSARRR